MKKLLLFGLSASFALITDARAQDPIAAPQKAIEISTIDIQLVAGQPHVLKLRAVNSDLKEVLLALAANAGAEARFEKGFISPAIVVWGEWQGTMSQLLERLTTVYKFDAIIATDPSLWFFEPRQAVQVRVPSNPRKAEWRSSNFNVNPFAQPVDPKKLSPDATPFEFNGGRVYRVPIRPNRQ